MNSKLTTQRAARYYGGDILDSSGDIYKLDASIMCEIEDGEQFRLLLTPLPAITDEHAIEVANLINLHHPFSEPLRFDCGLVKMGYQLQPNKSSSLYNYDVIDFLRSLGYDCDNAIEEGWAVDKTTLS